MTLPLSLCGFYTYLYVGGGFGALHFQHAHQIVCLFHEKQSICISVANVNQFFDVHCSITDIFLLIFFKKNRFRK